MALRVHQPEQSILDYRKQQQIRNAPALAMAATVMTAVASAYLGASLGVHWEIGAYAPNFFPDYLAKPLFGLPVYSPWELGKMAVTYWHYPMMQRTVELAGGIAALPTLLMAGWQFARIGRLQRSLYKTDLHGSAHWATEKEIRRMGLLPKGRQDSKRVCYVGGVVDKKGNTLYLQHSGAEHIIVFAPTRSGKGVGFVLPTLLGGWQESVVTNDIKGENYLLSAGWRQSIGQTILKFNPGFGMDADPDDNFEANNGDLGSEDQCCHFNPLDEVRVGTAFEVKDVMNIATMIVDPDGKGLNDHWQKTGFALLTCVILHVLYAEEDKTLRGVAAFLNDPNLQNVDQAFQKMIDTEHNPNGKFTQKWIEQYKLTPETAKVHPVIAQSAKEMLNKAPNEKSGVISTMMSFLSLYRDPIVAKWTAYSDFRIKDLQDAKNPVSLYLVTSPEDKNRLKPLIRLVLNLIASKFTSEDRLVQENGRMVCKGRHPLLLLLDEFPSLGKMDIFQDAIAFFAGYNVKLALIAQSKSQLEDEAHGYGKAGGSVIIENCHVRYFYAPNDVTTAEWLSKNLGNKTVAMENTTQSLEGSIMPSPKGQSRSLSYHPRPLLTPDEVLRLRGPVKRGSDIVQAGDIIVMVTGFSPIYGRQILYFKNPVFLERAKIDPPASFEPLRKEKDYSRTLGHTGVLKAKAPDQPSALEDADFTDATETTPPVLPADTAPEQPQSSLDALEAENAEAEGGDALADPDAQDAQIALDRLAQLHRLAANGLPPEMIAASGGEDGWRASQKRIDREAFKQSVQGLAKGAA
ncbi:type IV secretory system conjugative DNA transfer family protein [Acidithiobacillus sp. YTS05]|nr:type IV secretory system conjugative DNA transfer family protein [Acidithiobacillus sp. YTS05]